MGYKFLVIEFIGSMLFYTLFCQSKAWMVLSSHTTIPNYPMILSIDLFVPARMVLRTGLQQDSFIKFTEKQFQARGHCFHKILLV